jgi:hypothetical protein
LDWIAKRVQEVQAATPVREAVASRLEEELAGTMRERSLRTAELAALARALITATDPAEEEGAP